MRRQQGQHHSKRISQSNYHPYVWKTPPTLQADRKMASVMGRLASSIDSDCDDETVCKIFSQGLQQMSAERVRCPAYYKEAELEYHWHLSMTLVWEAKKLSRLKHFINGEQQEQEDQTDFEFITAVQKNKVERVKQLNAELDELNIFLPPASDLDDNYTRSIRDPHDSDHSSVGDSPEDELATGSECSMDDRRFVDFIFYLMKITIMDTDQPAPSIQRIVWDVPIVRQAGLNIAGHSLADQVGCVSEMPESMNTPELPPRINPPPIFSHDSYSSIPPNHQDGRRQGEGHHDSSGATTVPVIDKAQCRPALTAACSSFIAEDHLIKPWTDENISSLYKTIITPMSTLLNRFKQCAQDLVDNLYKLRMSIWTDPTARANHNKSTVEFLVGNNSINFIFGDPLEDGREVRFPFKHEAIIQIASRAAFCDGYNKFIKLDSDLDNIMAISGTTACCSLQEFVTGGKHYFKFFVAKLVDQ
ncbi:uncharacterized protein EDB91DRAFT_1082873 [Suillus paluster]|uniref:uncharacterized protein n=1 Tax=Suillus paluster TaxID=48578 RepID=UPI001B86723D|nr:uncharacterized protein EDB91DRAFT_1082873 [Suillus paluster]KAG1738116.1 hypothetical protein EDB91DRAFT_1082873 [Suillus paluster]